MRLYYFTTERFGIEALRHRRLKVARIEELNDPFEFLGIALERDERRSLRKFKVEFARRYGLICMSHSWKHPLLWGHYAEKHKGICLGFDVPDDSTFVKVEYRPERPTLQEFGCCNLGRLKEQDMLRLLTMKFSAWSYESEYRAFCTLSDKDPINGHFFLDFSAHLKLAQIIVGDLSVITRKQLKEVAGEQLGNLHIFKARPGFRHFEVVENQSKQAWK